MTHIPTMSTSLAKKDGVAHPHTATPVFKGGKLVNLASPKPSIGGSASNTEGITTVRGRTATKLLLVTTIPVIQKEGSEEVLLRPSTSIYGGYQDVTLPAERVRGSVRGMGKRSTPSLTSERRVMETRVTAKTALGVMILHQKVKVRLHHEVALTFQGDPEQARFSTKATHGRYWVVVTTSDEPLTTLNKALIPNCSGETLVAFHGQPSKRLAGATEEKVTAAALMPTVTRSNQSADPHPHSKEARA